jgi:TPR repeat protein
MLKRASNGDPVSMKQVAFRYKSGQDGFPKDFALASHWYQKGHAAGHVKATACLGAANIKGNGVDKCAKKGLMFLGQATAMGSDYAASELGLLLADASYGVPIDRQEAIRWLCKSLGDCPHKRSGQYG